jgi:hypothetical protein
MDARVRRLEVLYGPPAKAIEQASWSLQWALQFPRLSEPSARYQSIAATHGLDEEDLRRALVMALVRCGIAHAEAQQIAGLGVETVVVLAATAPDDQGIAT